MERKTTVLITFSIAILLVVSLYAFTDWFSKVTGYILGHDQTENLANCLKQNGDQFYSSLYCPECESTKKIFGSSSTIVPIVDCGQNGETCPNVREIPAWYLNGQIYYGFKNITQIDELSGCKVFNE